MYWRTTTVCSTVEWTLFLQLLVRMSGYIKLFNLRATEVPTLGKAYVTIIVYECSVGKNRLKYSSDKNTHTLSLSMSFRKLSVVIPKLLSDIFMVISFDEIFHLLCGC